jgi:hypothetical protein
VADVEDVEEERGRAIAAPIPYSCSLKNAMPCGLTMPVTTLVMTPVSIFNSPTEVGVAE